MRSLDELPSIFILLTKEIALFTYKSIEKVI